MIRSGRADATAVAADAQQVRAASRMSTDDPSARHCFPSRPSDLLCATPSGVILGRRSAQEPETTVTQPAGGTLRRAVLDLRSPVVGGIPTVNHTRPVAMTPALSRASVVASV